MMSSLDGERLRHRRIGLRAAPRNVSAFGVGGADVSIQSGFKELQLVTGVGAIFSPPARHSFGL